MLMMQWEERTSVVKPSPLQSSATLMFSLQAGPLSAATVKKQGSNVGWAKAVSTAKGEEAVWGVGAEMGERWQHSNANEERGRR